MSLPTTETVFAGSHIDARPTLEAAAFLLDGQSAAIDAVRYATPTLSQGAQQMASAIRAGKSLHYAAAGSSGLMALADASELRGTFGIPTEKIRIHMAGGVPVDGHMPGDTEDDGTAAGQIANEISNGDVVIVLTASGTTPYALAVAHAAQHRGATIIGIANNPGTPLLELADTPVCIPTPPEVVAGSTRLGAGTAQKAALNLMSTLMGVVLGHVYRGEMVNVIADNAKLVQRAIGMVSRITGVSADMAEAAIAQTGGRVKPAILVASGCSPKQALTLLEQHSGQLGPCLSSLSTNRTTTSN
ncbi:N-acetylmuramic acid 6-phosphate etherase [Yoonia sp. GPGPB17]|uniref:N-acetylmuramic acid 6-phosphate etherase n=1 Tax=Yoonia sp. GPGPB17 TaxID=3026147 RepID=UPI0030BFC0E5